MIEFQTLLQAANYFPKCLLCKSSMDFKNRDSDAIEKSYDSPYRSGLTTTITYNCHERDYIDSYVVHIETGEVKRDIQYLTQAMGGMMSSVGRALHPAPFGDKYLSIGMECLKCHKYNYLIQMIIDLESVRIARILLNSEKLSFYVGNEYHTIRNVYTTNKTEYSYYNIKDESLSISEKKEELPLITLNREDPTKTLKRIQNLLIFT